ncbi:alpha/beta fold hydrolase [Euzebya tangerina]|uniref:alpha/beta fold hydrolase n=1 Tax=Euzebya tangerina TaxID=591198 RepID=UPI000E312A20|nr:alpha/beta hydrolase [Euzebya tangerina]
MQTETVTIPHLDTTMAYSLAGPLDQSRPTLVLVNSFTTSAELYRPQFADDALTSTANLLAIELFGHGRTRSPSRHFTYWDTALANLQVMDALGIDRAFVLGTSQGGWVTARMAMLAPDRIQGIMPLGTSMDDESQRSRDLGCWDGVAFCTPVIEDLAEPVDDDWVVPDEFVHMVLGAGLGEDVSAEETEFWLEEYRRNYAGEAGRQRLHMCSVNLRDRDGLHGRLDTVTCPVLWLQGTADQVYSVPNAEDEITMFTRSPRAELQVVEDGQHFLSASDPAVVNAAAVAFLSEWS